MTRAYVLFLAIAVLLVPTCHSLGQSDLFGETMEVRIGTLDVVVTDKKGQPIQGLKAEDFQLIIDGKPQPIDAVDEVRQGIVQPLAQPPGTTSGDKRKPRHIIFFIDDYSLSFQRRNEALTSMNKFLERSWREGDQAMVAVWRGDLRIPQPFTGDRAKIEAVVKKHLEAVPSGYETDRQISQTRIRNEVQSALVSAASGLSRQTAMRQGYSNAISVADSYSEEQFVRVKNLGEDVKEVIRAAGGISGRKALVFLGENFPALPGLSMFEFANEMFDPYSRDLDVMIQPQSRAANRSLKNLAGEIARVANENEVALYTVYSGDTAAEPQIEQRSQNTTTQFLEFTNTAGTFSNLANMTGGLAIVGSRNFEAATGHIERDLWNFYTLTWKPGSDKKPRKIDVKVNRNDLVVRWRREFVGRSMDDEIAARVLSQLMQDVPGASDIKVAVGKTVDAGRKKMKVPIQITFPSSFLTLIERDGKMVGGFDVVLATSDDDNRTSEVARQRTQTSFTTGQVPAEITYTVDMVMRDRPGSISVAVVDAASKTPIFRRVDVPRLEN